MAPPPIVEVDGLRLVRRRRTVLQGVTFRLEHGVTALLGSNGIGKSTLLRALATLDRPASGSIRLHDPEPGPYGGRWYRRRIGFLPQDPEFVGAFTVDEALRFAAWLHEVDDPSKAAARVAEELDLVEHARVRLRALSGGTRRRVLLGQAVIHRPRLLLLDEPTVGMDASHRHALRLSLARLAEERAVLVSTHVIADLDGLCSRALVLGSEGLAFEGTVTELTAQGEAIADGPGPATEAPIDRAVRALGTLR